MIKIVDRRVKYDRFMKAIAAGVREASVKVGVDNRPHPTAKMPTDDLGAIHEFGLGVPQRSFLRPWIDMNESAIVAYMTRGVNDIIAGRETSFLAIMRRIGDYAVKGILGRIRAGILPELAIRTVKKKGHYLPLVDTHAMTDAIVYEVEGIASSGEGAFESGPGQRPDPLGDVENEFSAESVYLVPERTVGDIGP